MASAKKISNYVLLNEAIKRGDKVTAHNLILNNVEVNNYQLKCNTPLHWAITKFDDLDIMTMLLDKGADVHIEDQNHLKPLDIAIENNKTLAALLLIERGALIGEDLNPLLIKAIEKNNHAIVKSLIDNETQSSQDIDYQALAKSAISQGHPVILEDILPHCQFLSPADKYIPQELVIKPGCHHKEAVEVLFKWGFTIDPTSNSNKDFVRGSVKYGHRQVVAELLKLGINVHYPKTDIQVSLLKLACFKGQHEIVELLLEHNICLNGSDDATVMKKKYCHQTHEYKYLHSYFFHEHRMCGRVCLYNAVKHSDPRMTQLLLKYGAIIDDDPTFFNITCSAIRYNCEQNVRVFLDHGADVNEMDAEGKTFLHFCVFCSNHDAKYNIAKLLLEKGASVHLRKPDNPLFFEAVKNGHRKIAHLFLGYDANVQYISPEGNTLLHKAIKRSFDVKFIEKLLKLNLSANVANDKMITPFFAACKIKSDHQVEVIQLLLDYDANVNCEGPDMETPLHIACEAQNLEIMSILLKSGANPNAPDDKGNTPLHIVCKYENDKTASMIELLLEYHVNLEAADEKGWTPLFVACETGNDIAVNYLLDLHVNANQTDFDDLTPLYVAAKHSRCHSEIVKTLLKHQVNVHCINRWGNSVLHAIVENDNAELIKFIAPTQVNFNTINKKGYTPLHVAVKNRCAVVTESLIKYGSNVNIRDKKHRTPLQNAISWKCHFHYQDESKRKEIKKIIHILSVQVIKLITAKLKVNKENLELVYNPDENSDDEPANQDDVNYKIDIPQLEIDCEQEIERMRTESIDVYMTFYDLLTKNIHILSKHVRNKTIQRMLDLKEYDEKFPLYIDIVRSRFRDAKLRYRLMTAAKAYFKARVYSRLSDNCIDSVFSYLNIRAIKMVIRALRPIDK